MANCPNCNSKIGCTCKLRKASDGSSVCLNCIMAYESSLNSKVLPQRNTSKKVAPNSPRINTLKYRQV